MEIKNERIMRQKEVVHTVGLSLATIYRRERDGTFPCRISLGGNSCGWLASEIYAWILSKANARNTSKEE